MSEDKKDTRLDRFIASLKNHRVISVLLLFGVIVGALAAFSTSIKTLVELIPQKRSLPHEKVRYHYYSLSGHSIQLFLQGEFDSKLKESIRKTPFVWKNIVYDYVDRIAVRYSYRKGWDYLTVSTDGDYEDEETSNIRRRDFPRLPFSHYYSLDNQYNFGPLIAPLLNDNWNLSFRHSANVDDNLKEFYANAKAGTIDPEHIRLTKAMSVSEGLEIIKDHAESPIYRALAHNSPVAQNLFDSEIYYSICGNEYWANLLPRYMTLQILVVENISDKPLRISNLKALVEESEELRMETVPRNEKVFPELTAPGVITAEECILVPLRVTLSPNSKDAGDILDKERFFKPLGIDIAKASVLFAAHETINIGGETVSSSLVVKSLQRDPLSIPVDLELGPLLAPTELMVAGIPSDIRPESKTAIHVSHSYEGGSCPYLWIANGAGSWKYYGKVLTGRDQATRLGWSYATVPGLTEKIRISEEDPETTSLFEVNVSGENLLDAPRTLQRGDAIVLDIPSHLRSKELIKISFFGYYIPDMPTAEQAHEEQRVTIPEFK